MTRLITRLVTGLIGVWLAVAAPAQPGPDENAPLVELPPLLVEGERRLPPWLYAEADGTEYLSRCTSSTTRGYIERRVAQMHGIRSLIPPAFLLQTDVPAVTVLYSQSLRAQTQDEMVKELMDLRRRRGGSLLRNSRVGSVPNLMLEDRDFFAVFAYIDERNFRPEGMTVAVDYLDFLLERRTPALPAWLRAGLAGLYAQTRIDRRATIDPLLWVSTAESNAISANPDWPRTLVFAQDFFSPEVWRDEPIGSVRGRTLRAQSLLFVRWALDPQHGAREAFWRFAAAAGERPVTEEMMDEYFGFGFSDWRERLSDYLPEAVRTALELDLSPPPRRRVRVREATPAEVARLQGEWERLSIGFVRRRYPEFADRYIEQARATLTKAWVGGDRSPPLAATLGLCEIDAGNDAAARPYLEQAVAGTVVRPRVYTELARLRLAETESRRTDSAGLWTPAEIAAVVEPLHQAFMQRPPLPDAYRLLAQTLTRSEKVPTDRDWQRLEEGLGLFPDDVRLAYEVAQVHHRHGRNAEAVAVLGRAFPRVRDDATRRRYAELYALLNPPATP